MAAKLRFEFLVPKTKGKPIQRPSWIASDALIKAKGCLKISLLSTRFQQIFHHQTVTMKVGKTNPQRSIGKLLYLKLVMMCDRSVSFDD